MIPETATTKDVYESMHIATYIGYNTVAITNMHSTNSFTVYVTMDVSAFSPLSIKTYEHLALDIIRKPQDYKTFSGTITKADFTAQGGKLLAINEKTQTVVSRVTVGAGGTFSFKTPYDDEHLIVCVTDDPAENALVYARVIPI